MDYYKEACKRGLRIPTVKGLLSAEQIFTLKRSEIATSIKNLKKVMSDSNESDLDFLEEDKVANPIAELCFNILKDVYITLNDEAKAIKEAANIKAHNQRILELIASKKEKELENKSLEELEAMLK